MPARKKKPARSTPVTTLRLAARIVPVVLVLTVLMLCTAGDFYVHHPADWLADHRSVLTAPLEYFGDRTAFLTDALGWTGHDCVYESDDPVPENQVLFAGEPVRLGAPAPADIITLDRDEYLIGWSPSLQIPVWAAYHVPAAARFPYERSKTNFVKDRNVESSPAPTAYTNTGYDRSHMVPFNAIVTRFGPDPAKKTCQMTNIFPQKPTLNRGPWRAMEHLIAELWTQKYGEIWVVAGAIPGSTTATREKLAGSSIVVPEKCYMVIVAQTADGVRALAVLFEQTAGRWDFPVHNIVTIDELEKLCGLEFFPDMPKFLKTPLKRNRPTRLWPVRGRDLLKLVMSRFT